MRIELKKDNTKLVTNTVDIMPLERIIDWYRDQHVRLDKAHTARAKEQDFAALFEFFMTLLGKQPYTLLLEDVTEARLEAWRDWMMEAKGWAASTVNRRMATIRHMLNEVRKRVPGWHSPADNLKDIPVESEFRGIPPEYQDAMIKAAYSLGSDKRPGARFFRYRSGLMVEIVALCGLRAMEVLGLTFGHVTHDGRYFLGVKCKGGKRRNVYVPESLQESLRVWMPYCEEVLQNHYGPSLCLPEAPLLPTLSRGDVPRHCDYKTIHGVFAEASKIVDAGHFPPHSGRHGFARNIMDHTKDIAFVAETLGHASVSTTFTYLKTSPDTKAKTIEAAMRKR